MWSWMKRKSQDDNASKGEVMSEETSQEKMPSAVDELEKELKKLQDERDSLFERLARVTAEFKNAQKRLEDDKRQAIDYANSSLIASLLPVLDNFERALAVDPATTDLATFRKGMQLMHDQWLAVFRTQQVEQIAPKPGDAFDPNIQQAIMRQPSEEFKNATEPVVTMLLQKGYTMRERVIRPAQVAVNEIVG